MSFSRLVEPEWLDELKADDPRAVRSRRDLQRINVVMLQTLIFRRLLQTSVAPPRVLLEIGAGDGTFLLRVAKGLPHWRGVTAFLLDQQDIVTAQTRKRFAALGWNLEVVKADVFSFLPLQKPGTFDITLTNLFLHHFSDDKLRALLGGVSVSSRAFVACEPERSNFALWGAKSLWALACNDVTRHDAVTSVRAGFRGTEIAQLWSTPQWQVRESSLLFTHGFVATQPADAP